PANIKFELELTGERNAVFAANQKPSVSLQAGTPSVVILNSIPAGSVSYEFEWVFYDLEEKQQVDPFATRDPVRVATPKPETKLDTTYPSGKLYVRGRAVGRFSTASADGPAQRPGLWSDVKKIQIGSSALESQSNWNYLANYSEGSDFGSSIGFFDGALRNRQTQTRIASRDSRLIAETKYDREGRPILNFLPAPIEGLGFEYVPKFNAVDTPNLPTPTHAFDAEQFDGVIPPLASAASGAG